MTSLQIQQEIYSLNVLSMYKLKNELQQGYHCEDAHDPIAEREVILDLINSQIKIVQEIEQNKLESSRLKALANCCDKVQEVVQKRSVVTVMNTIPFKLNSPVGPVKMYIMSDGGHGGMEEIDYCPFCGTKLDEILNPLTEDQ